MSGNKFVVDVNMKHITKEERSYLQWLCFNRSKLANIYYYIQALTLWYRIKDKVPHQHYRVFLAVCLNLTVHFMGPQDVCNSFHVFKPSSCPPLFSAEELRQTHKTAIGFEIAFHLPPWKIARSIQWHVFLTLLKGRIQ